MTDKSNLCVLVLGATGMLGSTIFRSFSTDPTLETYGTIRDARNARFIDPKMHKNLIPNVHLGGEVGLLTALDIARPDVVVNCVGIIKQLPNASDHLETLAINASLPHRLAKYCNMIGARLVSFSTDCVFSGRIGGYTEDDFPDANDLYGRTKFLGEVEYENAVTLRTSIIGHELASANSLIDWFLTQSVEVKGFRRAVFSGLPAIEIAQVLRQFVLPNPQLHGLYHLSVNPINKYDLLNIVAKTYGKKITIMPDDKLEIDRSLNSDRFRAATGFMPRPWEELIKTMHADYVSTTSVRDSFDTRVIENGAQLIEKVDNE